MRSGLALLALSFLAGACAVTPDRAASGACATSRFAIDADFERGAFALCRITGKRSAELAIRPEPGATNDSAWYAFRVRAEAPTQVSVTLAYEGGAHRYQPKSSVDGRTWTRLPPQDVRVATDGAAATLTVRFGETPVTIAAQPLETLEGAIAAVAAPLARAGFEQRTLGTSADGRPIHAFESIPDEGSPLVVLLARQHPPETTGAVAFEAFVARLAEDDAAATQFRRRHAIFIAPMVNPDGFVRGHWRGNASGLDVNRDWGPFQTPEAVAVSARILALAGRHRPMFFADFHSTKRTVIYAAPESLAEGRMSDAFLAEFTSRMGEGAPEISRSHASARTTAKAWSLETLGAAGFTYEVADEADLGAVRAAARIAAEALFDVAKQEGKPSP